MYHESIKITSISLGFGQRVLFEDFSASISYGDKIGIIGNNGTGKSSFLKLLNGTLKPTSGTLEIPDGITIGYIEQTIQGSTGLSGGQRFLRAFSELMSQDVDLMMLDEPTNHLDDKNRRSLIGMIRRFEGTLVAISHDEEFLDLCVDKVWSFGHAGRIKVFNGSYREFLAEEQILLDQNEKRYSDLLKERKALHKNFVASQKGSLSKSHRDENDRSLKGKRKDTATKSNSKKKKKLLEKKKENLEQLHGLDKIEVLSPKFDIPTKYVGSSKPLVSIMNGEVRYHGSGVILSNIFIDLKFGERLHLKGKNGSGKTTLIIAILGDSDIIRGGDWSLIDEGMIGYLDQHYQNLNHDETVLESIRHLLNPFDEGEARVFLSKFLFRTNAQVHTKVKDLSGGEKARLSLAQISLKSPALLILDEVTNNLDVLSKKYIVDVLNQYEGGMIIISHDDEFVDVLGISGEYSVDG